MNIGAVVKTIRTSRGISAEQLAQRMVLHRTSISRLEEGESEWYSRHIILAAEALGLRPFMLLMNPRERRRAKLIFG
jgi:transcriptional regulator with XRE-family HTH domain